MYAELRSLSGSLEATIKDSQLLITYIPQDLIDGTQLFCDRTNVCRCSGAAKKYAQTRPRVSIREDWDAGDGVLLLTLGSLGSGRVLAFEQRQRAPAS